MKTNQVQYDIIVAGAGPAGYGAALSAARAGLRTLLLERNSCTGGMAGAGCLGFLGPLDNAGRNQMDWTRFRMERRGESYTGKLAVGEQVLGGIPAELVGELAKREAAYVPKFGYVEADVEAIKFLMESALLDAGVTLLYHAQVIDAAHTSAGITVQAALKQGVREFSGKYLIDATGDADVAVQLGADFKQGRDSDGKCQGVTLVFRIGNVQTDHLAFLPDSEIHAQVQAASNQAWERGEISFNPNGFGCLSRDPSAPGNFIVNHQHTYDVDGTKSEDLTRALINGRKQIQELVQFYRKYVPGCENCYLIETANQLGIRETRRIVGDYILTGEDVLTGRKFEDAICRYAYYMDMHLQGSEHADKSLELGDWYEIPYRSLLPQGIDNVLVAGRCISGTHEAMSSYRLMTSCMAMGQAAGSAAALANAKGIVPRAVQPLELKHILRENKAIV